MSYHKVNYKANGVDFTDYFPAYEVGTVNVTTIAANAQFTINLTKNKYSTTNYVSFIQPFYAEGQISIPSFSKINQFTIYNKTATSYNVWMNCDSSIVGTTNIVITLWCVTFYIQETEKNYVTSIPNLNYNVSSSTYNPVSYFPQFVVDQNTTTTTGDISIQNSLSTKNSLLTTYLNFGSVTNNSVSNLNAANVNKIIYFTLNKVSTSYTIRINATVQPITLNTITMYVPTISSNNFVSNYKVENVAFEDVFPICETFSISYSSERKTNRSDVCTLTKNTRATTDYVVITSYFYESNGSSGTFGPYAASINAGMPIIVTKTSTSFTVATTTSSGDNWNGGIKCLVIYL
jgi:hypothetical protein